MSKAIIVMSTCSEAGEAERIAEALVEQHLAACVNIVKEIKSVYRWGGEVVRDTEALLMVKTVPARFDEIRQMITDLSGYDLPEVIAVTLDEGSPEFLKWLADESGGKTK